MALSELAYIYPCVLCLLAGAMVFLIVTYLLNPVRLQLYSCLSICIMTFFAYTFAELAGKSFGTAKCGRLMNVAAACWISTLWSARIFYAVRINNMFSEIYSSNFASRTRRSR